MAGSDRCNCQKFVQQMVLSHPTRCGLVGNAPVVNWISGEASSLGLDLVHTSHDFALRDRLPPDDPVSRAQILRL